MRVLGVDPGNTLTGYGVVEHGRDTRYVAAGTIRPRPGSRGPSRLAAIFDNLLKIIDEYAPGVISLERSFVALNIQSAFTLGEARAMAMLAAAHRGLGLFEYTPTDVKLSVAGYGRADKRQVKEMVRRTLKIDIAMTLADDASDALAIALCHLYRRRIPRPEPRSRKAWPTGRKAARVWGA
jgi:crossover junction endodeoxyribonuclease RuvC